MKSALDGVAVVSPIEPGPRTIASGSLVPDERNKGFKIPPVSCRIVAFGAPPMAASVGSFMNSAAAILPPTDLV